MKLAAKTGLKITLIITLFSCCCISTSAQINDITPGTSVFVFRKPKKFFGDSRSGNNLGKRVSSKAKTKPAGSGEIVSPNKKSVPKKTEVVETIAPEEWINEQADAAIEERKTSDEEPFLSLSNGYLNSRAYFCETPQFPDAARRAKQKTVGTKVRVIVGKYGGVLSAEAVEGDAVFRSNVYQSLGSMTFRESFFMGQPVRIEGLVNFTQNPANSILCREAAQEIVVPAIVDGGNLNEFLQNCEVAQFPVSAKAAGLNSVEAKIQILVDEQGNVVDAKMVGGNAAFGEAARQAALKAKFRKTLIAGKAVKVRGELVFTQNPNNNVPCKSSAAQK